MNEVTDRETAREMLDIDGRWGVEDAVSIHRLVVAELQTQKFTHIITM